MNYSSLTVLLFVLAAHFSLSQAGSIVYTPPPKTKECLEREQTVIVLNLYQGFLNLTENIFAITEEKAKKFKDLVTFNEEIRKPSAPACKKEFPKFAKCKYDEATEILRGTSCKANKRKDPASSLYSSIHDQTYNEFDEPKDKDGRETIDKHSNSDENDYNDESAQGMRIMDKFDYDESIKDQLDVNENENEEEDENKYENKKGQVHKGYKRSLEDERSSEPSKRSSRSKRAIKVGQILRGKNGEITRVRRCYDAATISPNNNLRMTRSCSATTTLPANRFPRFLNEVICDFQDGGCIHDEGVVVQRDLFIKFKIDAHNKLTASRLGAWGDYQQKIRVSCECQIRKDSMLSGFVG